MKVNPKPVKKKPLHKVIRTKIFDALEWDAKRAGFSMFIGIILVFGVIQLPRFTTWQYWVFLVGMLLLLLPIYMRGTRNGQELEQKFHSQFFMCIPKEIIMKQAEAQKAMQQEYSHMHEEVEDEEEKEKLPN